MTERDIRCDDVGQTPATFRVGRIDFATLPKLDKLERTPTGGIRIPARVSRAGVLVYQRADGTVVREYRPESEAFSARSLKSLADAVVTVGHPPTSLVTPETAKRYSVGHVRGDGRREENRFVGADLAVLDKGAIDDIGADKLVDLSSGYTCVLEATPGTTPEGERYDAIQRDVLYNHVALLPAGAGRAGPDVSLRFDGLEVRLDAPAPTTPQARNDAMNEVINGKSYVVGSAEWAAAHALRLKRLDELEAEQPSMKTKLDELSKKRDEMQKSLDEANATIEQLKKDIGEATDETKMDARAADRAALIADVRLVIGAQEKLDGKSSDEMRRAAVTKLDGAAALVGADGKALPPADVKLVFDASIRRLKAAATQRSTNTDHRQAPTASPANGAALPSWNPYDLRNR